MQDEREKVFYEYIQEMIRTHSAAKARSEVSHYHSKVDVMINALKVPPPRITDRFPQHGIKVFEMLGRPKHVKLHKQVGIKVIVTAGYRADRHVDEISDLVLTPQALEETASIQVLTADVIA